MVQACTLANYSSRGGGGEGDVYGSMGAWEGRGKGGAGAPTEGGTDVIAPLRQNKGAGYRHHCVLEHMFHADIVPCISHLA